MEKRSPPCWHSPTGRQRSPFLPLPQACFLSNTFPPHFQGPAPLVFTAGYTQSLPVLSVRCWVAQDIEVACLINFICCSLLPSESSSRLPSVAALVWDLHRLQSLGSVPASVWVAFLCLQSCPQHCLPPCSPSAPLPTSPYMSSPCLLYISWPVSKHISSLNSSPKGCHSRLNMFE